jgi:hypothetical protein
MLKNGELMYVKLTNSQKYFIDIHGCLCRSFHK